MQNNSRSLNHDLDTGMVEGKYKEMVKNRGGGVDPATSLSRQHLHPDRYDITEAHPKVTPDGRIAYT